jgi:hypothetical protein
MKNNTEKRVYRKRKSDRSKKSFFILFSIIVIGFGIFSSVIYAQNIIKSRGLDKVTDSYILGKLGKLTEIPNEDPVYIAKVKDDVEMKKDMQMYADTKKGDYIIVFKQKAFIYDLNNNTLLKVIEFNAEEI